MTKLFVPVLLAFISVTAHAQDILNMPGSVPLEDHRPPATDLVLEGTTKILSPQAIQALKDKGTDLSKINPRTDLAYWKNLPPMPLNAKDDLSGVDLSKELDFYSPVPSRTGVYRFTVRQVDERGAQTYRVTLSKNAHTFLLRKNLLRKLGYAVPAVEYAPKFKIKFKGEKSKKDFIDKLKGITLGDPERWIIDGLTQEDQLSITIQDALIQPGSDKFINLSSGFLSNATHIKGSRILNSLIIPYSIVNVQESVNGLSWACGRVVNKFVLFDADFPEEFNPDKFDAIWMLNRIGKLTRQDFVDIVEHAYYPAPVAKLLVEKLISRKETAMKYMGLPVPKKTTADVNISDGPDLVQGEVTKEWWEGYASRFSYPDPESPLSKVEIRAFFKQKGLSTLLDSAVQKFDTQFLHGRPDIEQQVIKKQIEAAQKQFREFLRTGRFTKVPLGFFAFPTIDGDIAVSRDIVTGEYMGSDNVIQLADNIDMSVTPGVFVSAVGMPAGMAFQGGAGLRIGRSYTHLKPLKSIKMVAKEPYKNLLVQLVKKNNGKIFDELMSDKYLELDETQRRERVKEMMAVFGENMATGDAFVISDNISGDFYAGLGYKMFDNLQLQLTGYASKVSVGRLHIVKPTDNEIHIYKDRGDMLVTGVRFNIQAYMPIVTIRWQTTRGKAKTDFYQMDINPNSKDFATVENNIHAMRQIFKEGSLELLKKNVKPFHITHAFKEKVVDFALLVFSKFKKITNFDRIDTQAQDGTHKAFLRNSLGTVKGKDYQGLTITAINTIIEESGEEDISINNPNSGDPGDTFKGNSALRNSVMEVEIDPVTSAQIDDPFFSIKYRWKGWKIIDEKMKTLVTDVNDKFKSGGRELFEPLKFMAAKEYQLYAVDVDIYLYEKAMAKLLEISDKDLTAFLNAKGRLPEGRIDRDDLERKIRWVNIYRKEFKSGWAHLDKDAMKAGTKFIDLLEMLLDFDDFAELAGGDDNMFIHGVAQAFREGDENGDEPVLANTIGKFGSEQVRGPLQEIQEQIGIAHGEFYIKWLVEDL